MAQARLTDFFPQAKKPRTTLLGLKGSKSPGGRRLQPRRGRLAAVPPCRIPALSTVSDPPDSGEWPTLGQQQGSGPALHPEAEVIKREPALSDLVTPSKGEPLGAGSRSSTGKKRSRSTSVDGAPTSAVGSQRAGRVPSARRCLLLQPREAGESPVPEKSEVKEDAELTPTGASEPT
eukprot:g29700.t1